MKVTGWSATLGGTDLHIDEWRRLLGEHLFHIPPDSNRPTLGQLWNVLMRSHFGKPVKGHPSEADWETGAKLGHLLGLSSELLSEAGAIEKMRAQSKLLSKAVEGGAVRHLQLDEPALRADLAAAKRRRDAASEELTGFRVDDRYVEHQDRADLLSAELVDVNDESLILRRRRRELASALEEHAASINTTDAEAVRRLYAELGVVLVEGVRRRYEDVNNFHESVVRNRRAFLQQEVEAVDARIAELNDLRRTLDAERSGYLSLLREKVALDTFMGAQRSLAHLESVVADLERRIETAQSLNGMSDEIKIRVANLTAAVRTELSERSRYLEAPIALFNDLGREIYSDRDAQLLLSPTSNGLLRVEPRVSGDSSTGVRSVETFILDMVSAITAMQANRAPRIVVHDSHLFDAIDGRQVASCLNIGARLADAHGFQYIVTMNSDFLDSVVLQSDGAFDPTQYVMSSRLSDEGEDGGLFGFKFD